MYDPLLKRVAAAASEAGWLAPAPALPERLDELGEGLRARLGLDLPADYRLFLAKCDGLSWDGLTFFGTGPVLLDVTSGTVRQGLIDANEDYRARLHAPRLILVGQTDEAYLAYDPSRGGYCSVDLASLEYLDLYESLDQMIVQVLVQRL